ncbi:pirin family protein [Sulfuriflexus mobilis]|uniref:pirin family protein n=1 Tax=Sulfuriflexus mobilis TaxID=1811807 RepID=UPI0015586B25|nr:pirin family protein [Sulfuriflexus mobilis]
MTNTFTIRQSMETMEGDGVTVKRLMPIPQFMNFDPFVLWDHFELGAGAGFPDHPHRGFEAITYMFHGSMQHADNLGNHSTVMAGGAQRFTAGSGIVHSEMPAEHGNSSGIQLWINLPKSLKAIEAGYQQVDAQDIPERQIGKAVVRNIVGADAPVHLHTQVRYAEVLLDAGGNYREDIAEGLRGFVYVVSGRLAINGKAVVAGSACFMEKISELDVYAEQTSRFMLCFGRPHHEAIKQYGPFVD